MSTHAQHGAPERLFNTAAERMILGNILAREGFFKRVGPQLTEDCFALEAHRRLFQRMREIHESGGDPTHSECLRLLIEAQTTAENLGWPELASLSFETVEIVNPDAWVRELNRKSAERRAWRAAERLQLGMEAGTDAAGELEAAREELRAIEGSFGGAAEPAGTIADSVASIGIETLLAAPKGTISSPWEGLNNITNGGPRPGELWTVGARPSVGKSTVCLQWALEAARAGHRVMLLSLEMPCQDLLKRALSAEGDIPHTLLVRGDLSSEWRFRFAQTLDRIGDYRLEISDQVRTLPAIIGKIAATPGLNLLVVDYLGLIEPGGRYENRNQEVSAISRRLKLAALDYGIPIIAAHQLNRANDSENRPPRLSDLRDSGSIEQDSDGVLLLDAPGVRDRSGAGDRTAIDVIIAKQRNGMTGHRVPLRLEGKFCRMIEAGAQEGRTAA